MIIYISFLFKWDYMIGNGLARPGLRLMSSLPIGPEISLTLPATGSVRLSPIICVYPAKITLNGNKF
jgi:hypothetical protein